MRYIVKVNPKYEGIREWVEKVVRDGMPADGEVIYRGRNVLYRADAMQSPEVHYKAIHKQDGNNRNLENKEDGKLGDGEDWNRGDGVDRNLRDGEDRNLMDREDRNRRDGEDWNLRDGEDLNLRDGEDRNRGTGRIGTGGPRKLMVVVKEFKKPNLVNAYVYTTVRRSKAERSFRNAMKMSELGFLTPEPVAYGEVRRGLKLVSSCYICRELVGASEMRNWEDFPNADTLIPAFAKEIYRLHQAGVWHKDFSPGNILYKQRNRDKGCEGEYDFYYVDLNRMRFGVHDRKRLMSMFRSINLNPEETRKLAGYYAEVAGLDKRATEKEALDQLAGYFAERGRKAKFKKLLHLNKK